METFAQLPKTNLPRVLIIGGGFGGIQLARSLRKLPVQVVLVDRNNYHMFQPLLYQVATGGLEPDSIAFPLRTIFGKQDNLIFRMAEVEGIVAEKKYIRSSIGLIRYDYLVLATGTQTNFFGMEGVAHHSVGMKTIPEALDLRSLILENFERALMADKEQESDLLKFVVVGGGPTGVETAGSLAELKKFVLPNDYPELDFRQMEIHLVEAGDSLLAGMSDFASQEALKALRKMGVHVWLNTMVADYDGHTIQTKGAKSFEAATMIWAAGVKGNVPEGIAEHAITRGHRLVVNTNNQVHGYEDIYAIGDL
ncbi:MAG: FAD-dependent oxidoreductase, partial [Bacteroidota bacterium]